jgi:hypothetical protein
MTGRLTIPATKWQVEVIRDPGIHPSWIKNTEGTFRYDGTSLPVDKKDHIEGGR